MWVATHLGVQAFDAETIERVHDEAGLGFVLRVARVRGTQTVVGTVAMPVRDVDERRLAAVDRVLLRHLCGEYRARHPVYDPNDT